MLDYVKRMQIEKEDLSGKIRKLGIALDNKGLKLPDEKRRLMTEQLSHMKKYLLVLEKRINLEVLK